MSGRRSRSRSPIRRSGGGDRRGGGRDRNGSSRSGFNQQSDKMVYLSNLPYEMSWMELKAIIREKAGEVNFVETLEDRDGRSKGCAVVEFKTKDSAIKCVELMHRQDLKGRNILAKEIRDPVAFFRKVKDDTGIDFLGSRDRMPAKNRYDDDLRHSTILQNDNETYGLSPAFLNQLNIKTPLINRVFITNISFSCGVGRLYDICALAGKVIWFDLQLDKDGKSKGMAVCQYSHPIEAVQAISMLNGQRIYDRVISVKMDRFEKEPERREGELPAGLRGIGMGLGANGAPLADVASVISSISSNSGGVSLIPQPQPLALVNPQLTSNPFINTQVVTNPFVSNALQQQLQQFGNDSAVSNLLNNSTFSAALQQVAANGNGSYQSQQSQQYFGSNNNGSTIGNTSSIQGLFGNKSSQATAGINSAAFGGNAAPTPLMGSTTANSGSHSSYNNSGAGGGNSYDNQASRVILIKNLPMDYTWQIVSDRVQQFGDLDSVEIVSPGVAKVRFIQLSDAERAKQTLQGTTVESRVIGIEYL